MQFLPNFLINLFLLSSRDQNKAWPFDPEDQFESTADAGAANESGQRGRGFNRGERAEFKR